MSSVESIRQRAISKLTRKYGKAYVRLIMNPRHSTNALIPQPVQQLTRRIQEADSVAELQGYEEAAEGILSGRIQPRQLAQMMRAGPEVDIRGGGMLGEPVVLAADNPRSGATRRVTQENINELQIDLLQAEDTINYLEATVAKKNDEIAGLKEQMQRMRKQFEEERAEMRKRMEEERAAMRKQMEEEIALIQTGDADAIVKQLRQENQKLKTEKAALEQQNQKVLAASQNAQKLVSELTTIRGELKEKNAKLKSENAALQRENAKLKSKNAALERNIYELTNRAGALSLENEQLKKLLAAVEAKLGQAAETAKDSECQKTLKVVQAKLNECTKKTEQMGKEILKLENDLEKAEEQAAEEKALREKVDSELAATKRQAAAAAQRAKEEKLQADQQSFAGVSPDVQKDLKDAAEASKVTDDSSDDEGFDNPKEIITKDRLNNAAEGKTQDKGGLNMPEIKQFLKGVDTTGMSRKALEEEQNDLDTAFIGQPKHLGRKHKHSIESKEEDERATSSVKH